MPATRTAASCGSTGGRPICGGASRSSATTAKNIAARTSCISAANSPRPNSARWPPCSRPACRFAAPKAASNVPTAPASGPWCTSSRSRTTPARSSAPSTVSTRPRRRISRRTNWKIFSKTPRSACIWWRATAPSCAPTRPSCKCSAIRRRNISARTSSIFTPTARSIDDILARLHRHEGIDQYPARLRAKDGSIRHVLITSNARVHNGEFVNTRCLTIDVTEQKIAQDALARRMEEQAALHAFTERLQRAETLDEVYDAALAAIMRALDCQRAVDPAVRRFGFDAVRGVALAVGGISPRGRRPFALDADRPTIRSRFAMTMSKPATCRTSSSARSSKRASRPSPSYR